MADMNKDEEDGLAPDTAWMWKDQVYPIVNEALLFLDSLNEDGSTPWHPQTRRSPSRQTVWLTSD